MKRIYFIEGKKLKPSTGKLYKNKKNFLEGIEVIFAEIIKIYILVLIKDLITSGVILFKQMVSGERISNYDNIKINYTGINLWNVKEQMFIIVDIFYSAVNLKTVILISSGRLVYLINTGTKIYLIREEKVYEFGLSYMADLLRVVPKTLPRTKSTPVLQVFQVGCQILQ